MIVTKLRIGDANTMMAEGGIQAADKANDCPASHYLDAFGGGHFAARPELLRKLVMEAPERHPVAATIWAWSSTRQPDGTMITTHGGGTSRKRMHAAKDYSGAEIMRTLRDEVLNREIPVVDFTAAIELILDENGHAAGAVLLNMETGELPDRPGQDRHHRHRRRGTAALSGLPHLQPLRRHRRRPGSGLSRGREASVCRIRCSTIPPARPIPTQIFGALVTEKVRSLGAKLINADGEAFMHPAGDPRRVRRLHHPRMLPTAARAWPPPNGQAVWLDTPMIEHDPRRRHAWKSAFPPCCACSPSTASTCARSRSWFIPPCTIRTAVCDINANGESCMREPVCGRRGRRRHPWPQPSDGQLPAGRDRLRPSAPATAAAKAMQGRAAGQADPRRMWTSSRRS